MKRALLSLILSLAGAVALSAAIDLTPTVEERMFSGVKFTQLIFHENGRTITYQQPPGWSYGGGGPQLRLTPPGVTQAQAEITQAPLPAPQNFDEPAVKALQQQVLSSAPANSQNVALVEDAKNPLLINRHETYEVTIGYQLYGQEYQTSVLFLNLPDNQVRFRATARKADFEKVHQAFRGSLFSLQWK